MNKMLIKTDSKQSKKGLTNETVYAESHSKEVSSLLPECMKPTVRTYRRNDVIMRFSEENNSIGFVTSGMVYLNSINSDGQKNIIDYYEKNEIFGKRLSPDGSFNGYYVTAKTKCEITFVPYEKLITCCENCCERHIRLIDYLINVSIKKSQTHIDILSQRTIRNKLIYFFRYLSEKKDMRHITIPLSLSDLADYLSVDRSAMMREIKKLNDEGYIKSNGKKILLLK